MRSSLLKIFLFFCLINICYASDNTNGRIIGYLPAWTGDKHTSESLPDPLDLKNAGYTNILVAFGLFDNSSPENRGNVLYVADYASKINKDYITKLHQAGIRVSLSIGGGAQPDEPDTSINFHQVLSTAKDNQTFQKNFVTSVQNLMNTYGFDGIDIDIESGFGPNDTSGNQAEFLNQPPVVSDITTLASILNTLYANNPHILISLVPQTTNISPATNGFNSAWANYSSLIMQTYHSLAWVGVQLYYSGGIGTIPYSNNGIYYGDHVLINNGGNDQTFGVGMAANLLETWPSVYPAGSNIVHGNTYFMPYDGTLLRPDQVVLGYPAPDSSGYADAAPITNTSAIKQTLLCLQTANAGCNLDPTTGYKPPHAYGSIGGVFNWQVMYDKNNGYQFANDLKECVLNGNCN